MFIFLVFFLFAATADAAITGTYSSYIGTSGTDQIAAIETDSSGNIYLTGYTTSGSFAVTTGMRNCSGMFEDVFVSKFNAAGSLIFSTCMGGNSSDKAYSIAIAADGSIFIAGATTSNNFPTTAGLQTSIGGNRDAFVFKLSATGTIIYSTYFGGTGDDYATDIAITSFGDAYITGGTTSNELPGADPVNNPNSGGGSDAYFARLIASGALAVSRLVGGTGYDVANTIALDGGFNPVLAGSTSSIKFTTSYVNVFQIANAGSYDGFVAKVSNTGQEEPWFVSFFGGPDYESITAISLDANDNIYITGTTNSGTFPILSAYQSIKKGMDDAFVGKFFPGASDIAFSTYLGGSYNDEGRSISVDPDGYVYVTGITRSLDYPVTVADNFYGSWGDMFVSRLSPTGSHLDNSMFIGGDGEDTGTSLIYRQGIIYVAGNTGSSDIPLYDETPYKSTFGGGWSDGYFAVFNVDNSRDDTLPSILSISPADNAESVPLTAPIVIELSEAVNANTINALNVYVTLNGAKQTSSIIYEPISRTITIIPSKEFNYDSYYVVVIQNITDLAGNTIQPFVSVFYTIKRSNNGVDVEPPSISTTFPAANSEENVSAIIKCTFSETINADTLTSENFYVAPSANNNSLVSGLLNYDPTTFTATFSPSSLLDYDTQYVVTVANVNDVAGNTMQQTSWTFSTKSAVDTTSPSVVSSVPDSGVTGVITNSSLAIYFSEAMAANSFVDGTVVIEQPGVLLSTVDSTLTYDDRNNAVVVVPETNLLPETLYKVSISGVTDKSSNIIIPASWEFTTGIAPDTYGPILANYSPTGTTTVSVNIVISARFSEALDQTTLTNSSFFISGMTGTVTYDTESFTATFTPSGNLDYETNYSVHITDDVKDSAGNSFERFTWSFETKSQTETSSSAEGTKVGCFIATAAFGSEMDPHVKAFRKFRDEVLMKTYVGRTLVNIYYNVSPPIADFIRDKEHLKAIVRFLLLPSAFLIENPELTKLLFLVISCVLFGHLIMVIKTRTTAPRLLSMHFKIIKKVLFPLLMISFLFVSTANADCDDDCADPFSTYRFGYGYLTYNESTDAFGTSIKADSTTPVVLLSYTRHYYVGSSYFAELQAEIGGMLETADEEWSSAGSVVQRNNMAVTGPLGIGIVYPQVNFGMEFPNSTRARILEIYVSGGYDLQLFKRTDFVDTATGTITTTPSYELFQLPRAGLGLRAQYEPLNSFGLFFAGEYDFVFSGKVTNSLIDAEFGTSGSKITGIAGVSYTGEKIATRLGVRQTILSLDESDVKSFDDGSAAVFPNSDTDIIQVFLELQF